MAKRDVWKRLPSSTHHFDRTRRTLSLALRVTAEIAFNSSGWPTFCSTADLSR